jgi:hypothetical protein
MNSATLGGMFRLVVLFFLATISIELGARHPHHAEGPSQSLDMQIPEQFYEGMRSGKELTKQHRKLQTLMSLTSLVNNAGSVGNRAFNLLDKNFFTPEIREVIRNSVYFHSEEMRIQFDEHQENYPEDFFPRQLYIGGLLHYLDETPMSDLMKLSVMREGQKLLFDETYTTFKKFTGDIDELKGFVRENRQKLQDLDAKAVENTDTEAMLELAMEEMNNSLNRFEAFGQRYDQPVDSETASHQSFAQEIEPFTADDQLEMELTGALIGNIVGLKDPVAGRKIEASLRFVASAVKLASDISAAEKLTDVAATSYLGVGLAAFNLYQAFASDGDGLGEALQQMSEQLETISLQLYEMHVQMHNRFDQVTDILLYQGEFNRVMLQHIAWQLDQLDEDTDRIQQEIAGIRQSLDRTEQFLNGFAEDQIRNEWDELISRCLTDGRVLPGATDWYDPDDVTDCLMRVKHWGVSVARNNIFTNWNYPADAALPDSVQFYSPFEMDRYNGHILKLLKLYSDPREADIVGRFPKHPINPFEWYRAVELFSQVHFERTHGLIANNQLFMSLWEAGLEFRNTQKLLQANKVLLAPFLENYGRQLRPIDDAVDEATRATIAMQFPLLNDDYQADDATAINELRKKQKSRVDGIETQNMTRFLSGDPRLARRLLLQVPVKFIDQDGLTVTGSIPMQLLESYLPTQIPVIEWVHVVSGLEIEVKYSAREYPGEFDVLNFEEPLLGLEKRSYQWFSQRFLLVDEIALSVSYAGITFWQSRLSFDDEQPLVFAEDGEIESGLSSLLAGRVSYAPPPPEDLLFEAKIVSGQDKAKQESVDIQNYMVLNRRYENLQILASLNSKNKPIASEKLDVRVARDYAHTYTKLRGDFRHQLKQSLSEPADPSAPTDSRGDASNHAYRLLMATLYTTYPSAFSAELDIARLTYPSPEQLVTGDLLSRLIDSKETRPEDVFGLTEKSRSSLRELSRVTSQLSYEEPEQHPHAFSHPYIEAGLDQLQSLAFWFYPGDVNQLDEERGGPLHVSRALDFLGGLAIRNTDVPVVARAINMGPVASHVLRRRFQYFARQPDVQQYGAGSDSAYEGIQVPLLQALEANPDFIPLALELLEDGLVDRTVYQAVAEALSIPLATALFSAEVSIEVADDKIHGLHQHLIAGIDSQLVNQLPEYDPPPVGRSSIDERAWILRHLRMLDRAESESNTKTDTAI